MSRKAGNRTRRMRRINNERLRKARNTMGINEHGKSSEVACEAIVRGEKRKYVRRFEKVQTVSAFVDTSVKTPIESGRIKPKGQRKGAPLRYNATEIAAMRKLTKRWP